MGILKKTLWCRVLEIPVTLQVILWKPKFHYYVNNSPPVVLILARARISLCTPRKHMMN
jgi:hypothetical protein